MVKADTEFETLICTKCKKEIGKKKFYRSVEDKEFYHVECVEKSNIKRQIFDTKDAYTKAEECYKNIKLGDNIYAKILYNYSKNLQEENKPRKTPTSELWKIEDLICKDKEYVKIEYLTECKKEANKEEK